MKLKIKWFNDTKDDKALRLKLTQSDITYKIIGLGRVKVMEQKEYTCPKCGNRHYESDQFQATGGNFAKIFEVQNKKFITVSCTSCGYTELYKGTTRMDGIY